MRRVILFLISTIFLTACGPESDPFANIRPLWKRTFIAKFDQLACRSGSLFTSCYSVEPSQCSTDVRDQLFPQCLKELSEPIPFIVGLPNHGRKIGSTVGSCIGREFEKKYAPLEVVSSECTEAKKRFGVTTLSALEKFLVDNPEAKVVYERAPEHRPILVSLKLALENQQKTEFLARYAELQAVLHRLIEQAPDPEIIALYRMELTRKEELNSISPVLCDAVFFNSAPLSETDKAHIDQTNQTALIEQQKQLRAAAVTAAIRAPQKLSELDAIEASLAKIPLDSSEKGSQCDASIALLSAILALPEPEAGPVLRALHNRRAQQAG
jgi:hypothetical protein